MLVIVNNRSWCKISKSSINEDSQSGFVLLLAESFQLLPDSDSHLSTLLFVRVILRLRTSSSSSSFYSHRHKCTDIAQTETEIHFKLTRRVTFLWARQQEWRRALCIRPVRPSVVRLHFFRVTLYLRTQAKNPLPKKERVRLGSISHHPFPYFAHQNPHFRPKGPENPYKY